MNDILGKWQQPEGQAFPGLWFEFLDNGKFKAVYEEMGITSSGTYKAVDGRIDMDQTQHTLGLIAKFEGRYEIDGDTLTMNLSDPYGNRPDGIEGKNKRVYKKID